MTRESSSTSKLPPIDDALLSGYLDGELTQQESQKVYLHLQQCEESRARLDELRQVSNLVKQLEEPSMSEQQLDALLADKPAKAMAWSGGAIIIVTMIVVVIYGAYQFYMLDDAPIWLKVVKTLLVGGVALLFGSVLRQRLIARKTDKYRKVKL